jgi:hypothetical protein
LEDILLQALFAWFVSIKTTEMIATLMIGTAKKMEMTEMRMHIPQCNAISPNS